MENPVSNEEVEVYSELRRKSQKILYVISAVAIVFIFIPLAVFMGISIFEIDELWNFETREYMVKIFSIVSISGIFILIPAYVYYFKYYNRAQESQEKINRMREQLPSDFEGKLIAINLKYLDQYYLETRVQANKSFISALVMGFISFCIIIVSIVSLMNGRATEGTIILVSGTITQFLSAVFFYLFNRTVISMAAYHQRLVFTQNIALAMKVAQTVDDKDRSQIVLMIVDRLLQNLNSHLGSPHPSELPSQASGSRP